jgi:hypothetical protein
MYVSRNSEKSTFKPSLAFEKNDFNSPSNLQVYEAEEMLYNQRSY